MSLTAETTTSKRYSAYATLKQYMSPDSARQEIMRHVGSYIIAKANGEPNAKGSTVLDELSVDLDKEYATTFTITYAPVEDGKTYLCEISQAPLDRNQRPYYIVRPLIEVDTDQPGYDALSCIFRMSGLFTQKDRTRMFAQTDWNFNNMLMNVKSFDSITYLEDPYIEAARVCVEQMVSAKISAATVIAWLSEPTEEQKAKNVFDSCVVEFVKVFAKNPDTASTAYPHLTKKIHKKLSIDHITVDQLYYFFVDSHSKYKAAVHSQKLPSVAGNPIQQIEAYLKFDDERHAAQRAAKKATKKTGA